MHISRAVIYDIAVRIERNGIEFYKAMKERVDDDFIDFMIEEEKQHIRVFTDIFQADAAKADESMLGDYMDESMLAAAYADTSVFALVDPKTADTNALYALAISMEKNALLFYSELIAGMPESYQEDIKLLKGIRDEEKKHLLMLIEAKSKLSA
jgi:rubrerythrin